jgi:hypothetical protein
MDHQKFRQALSGLLTRHPQLRRRFQATLRADHLAKRVAAVDRHYLVWQSLQKLEELSPVALELIRDNTEDLEPWHEHKINLAAEYLEAVVDALRCKAEHEVPPYQCEDGVSDTFGAAPMEIAEDNLETEDFE